MVEIVRTMPRHENVVRWLERDVKPRLAVNRGSAYAQGRMQVWLRVEPSLRKPPVFTPGLWVSDRVWQALQQDFDWDFHFALVTYSGEGGVGITAHQDANYAEYEARSVHLTGECEFHYWKGYDGYVWNKGRREFNPKVEKPTHIIKPTFGDIVKFNCKNTHAALPSPGRWNINVWHLKAEHHNPEMWASYQAAVNLSQQMAERRK